VSFIKKKKKKKKRGYIYIQHMLMGLWAQ